MIMFFSLLLNKSRVALWDGQELGDNGPWSQHGASVPFELFTRQQMFRLAQIESFFFRRQIKCGSNARFFFKWLSQSGVVLLSNVEILGKKTESVLRLQDVTQGPFEVSVDKE